MRKKAFRYRSIFLYSSLQFCGNIEEYFAKNTQKLVVFIVLPRVKNRGNLLRVYKEGSIVEQKEIKLSENIFLYYFLWYINYIMFIFKYFTKRDKVVVISFHPISFFGMGIQRLLRNVRFVFWTEYFPRISLNLRLYDNLKRYFYKRVELSCYFGDGVNKLMNGRVLHTLRKRTILWGVNPKMKRIKMPGEKLNILFVGLVKESQGLDLVFEYLRQHEEYSLKIIGVCDDILYTKYQKIFIQYQIAERVYFPNKFFSEKELQGISKECFVGVAPYTTGKDNGTYYIDPGKIKAYAELGIPIVMSNTSAIAPYIKNFDCGEVIERTEKDLDTAFLRIRNNYSKYLKGLKKFNSFFYYESHYAKNFKLLESFS